jgi:hypothetical protein
MVKKERKEGEELEKSKLTPSAKGSEKAAETCLVQWLACRSITDWIMIMPGSGGGRGSGPVFSMIRRRGHRWGQADTARRFER